MAAPYKRKDHYYEKAKESGYRSRAAFKLIELSKRFKILNRGDYVLDLGCWPGSWLQVAARKTGPDGLVVGIDLQALEDLGLQNVVTIVGDAGDPDTINSAIKVAGRQFNLLLSDMSPKLSGIREVDQARIAACGEMALNVCRVALHPGGNIVMKLFKGGQVEDIVREARKDFKTVKRIELDATRSTSNEFYIVGMGFHGQ